MLVLSRKIGQEIVVGDNVRITVTKVAGNRVTLGIEAPDHVRILRGELEPIVRSFDDVEDEADMGRRSRPSVLPLSHQLCRTDAMLDGPDTIPLVPNAAH